MFGERLKRARDAAGLSMAKLGNMVGVSANMIKKYEHNLSTPSSGVVVRLSASLGVRSEFFFRTATVNLSPPKFRKRARTSQKLLKKIEADVVDQAERWFELMNLWPHFPLERFAVPEAVPAEIRSIDQAEAVADALRAGWELGIGPIPSVIDVLESHGILVLVVDVDGDFDGLQATVQDLPVVVVSSRWSGDRQRFTLTHELGHLLLDGDIDSGIDPERLCHRFAGALLLPREAAAERIGPSRRSLEPQELFALKQEYGLSMAAIVYRAADLGIISQATRREIFIEFGRRGWRTREPGDQYPSEQTRLFPQLVYRALAEGHIGESKAAELLRLSLDDFYADRVMENAGAGAGQ